MDQETIEETLKEAGPLTLGDLLVTLSQKEGRVKQSEVMDVLDEGPFYEDGSGRFYLGE